MGIHIYTCMSYGCTYVYSRDTHTHTWVWTLWMHHLVRLWSSSFRTGYACTGTRTECKILRPYYATYKRTFPNCRYMEYTSIVWYTILINIKSHCTILDNIDTSSNYYFQFCVFQTNNFVNYYIISITYVQHFVSFHLWICR